MIIPKIITASCLLAIICACNCGNLWAAGEENTSPLFDKAAIIRDLEIKDPARNPYVTLDEWLAEAPTPPKGLSDERRAAFYRAWTTLWINTEPAGGKWWTHPIICPGHNYRHGIWIWDSAFHIMGLLHGGPKARQLALWQIEVMLGGQHETGKVPREIWRDGPQFLGDYGVQAPGLLTMAANRLLNVATTDAERAEVRKAMADFYPKFVRNHDWFFANVRTDIGLCIWKGWDSGWDTSTRWDKEQAAALDLSCFLLADRVELAKMARTLGMNDEAGQWDARAVELRDTIRKLHWSEKSGIYNDVNADKTISDSITPAIFWPMWAGVPTDDQVTITAKYLSDPKMFAATWPMPSVALGDPRFRPSEYWRGPTWINLNWIAVRGLQRYGQNRAAAVLREKSLDLIARTPVIYEYYNPLTGDGLGSRNYGWTAALYIDMILEP